MSKHPASPTIRRIVLVTSVTTVVAACPVAIVWWLRASGRVTSAPLGMGLGMVISLALSSIGRILWETRTGSEDLLFSELMVWGYVHRIRSQRRLANVAELLEREPAGAHPRRQDKNVKALQQLVSGLETHDPYLHGHSRRVARYSWMIARRMGLPGEEVARIRTAAAIHDVGKIHTPKSILHKPDRLSDAEYEVIKRHPGDGAEMVKVLGDEALTSIVRHHHERVDGSGYPAALKGEEIPLGARIVAVADTFDAITSARAYRAASPHKKAIDIIKGEAGTRLDGDVVKAFCEHYAGRDPLALWSILAGLPERVVGWLGTGAASVASAAKIAAVAAIVGSSAVGAAVSATAQGSHHRRARGAVILAATSYTSAGTRAPSRTSPATVQAPGGPAHQRSARRPHATVRVAAPRTSTISAGPSTVAQSTAPAAGVSAAPVSTPAQGGPGASGEAPVPPAGEEPSGKAVTPKSPPERERTKAEEEAIKKAEEKAAAKVKAKERAAAKAKAEEEAKLRAEEKAKAKAKAEEEARERAAAKLEREEAAAKVKAEKEAKAKAKEETKAKVKEEEAALKVKGKTSAP